MTCGLRLVSDFVRAGGSAGGTLEADGASWIGQQIILKDSSGLAAVGFGLLLG